MSNLKKHLERKHPLIDLRTYRTPQLDNNVEMVAPEESTSEIASSINMTPSTIQIARPPKRSQLSLHTYVPKKISASSKLALDDNLLRLYYIDCRPFSMVEDKGFKDFVKMLNPAYSLPSRQTLSKTSLPFA